MIKESQLITIARPLLSRGLNKDFYLHTLGVVKASKAILASGIGRADIVIPAAIFHDTGWSLVPTEFQGDVSPKNVKKGMKIHLIKGAEIAEKELAKLHFKKEDIEKIKEAIAQHKYYEPESIDNKILIDADNLSDIYKEQFESDIIAYDTNAKALIEYRSKNTFYTDIARKIFREELNKRKQEYGQ